MTTPRQIAEYATMQSFLNCYLREMGGAQIVEPGSQVLGAAIEASRLIRCSLPHQGIQVLAPLRYWSPTGRHRFSFPLYYRAVGQKGPLPLDYITMAALLAKELILSGHDAGSADELLLRVIQSCRNIATFVETRQCDLERLYGVEFTFADAEQSLVFGHPLHPTPKSRQGIADEDLALYSPELNGRFPLHYFRAHRSVVQEDSAHPQTATALIKRELVKDPEVDPAFKSSYCDPDDYALIPAHPLQASLLLREPAVRELIGQGLLAYLGAQGRAYLPTSSLRTVYHPDATFMLKLPLRVKITNSLRVNKRRELERGVEIHRLLDSPIGRDLRERFPRFHIVRDPAYITVALPGKAESGFEVVLRENPFHGSDAADATPVAALCQDHLGGGRSRLAAIIDHLAREEGRPAREVSRAWFRRYLEISLRPILWLYLTYGIAVEAHQQNSIVQLRAGYPDRFFYRDNQGYYYRRSAHDALERILPGLSAKSETTCEDAVADERLRYYLIINNLFGLINAFGTAGLVDERVLLADLRGVLEAAGASTSFVRTTLDEPVLRCKANLLTRLHDMDELTGPLASQSVYVPIVNPLRGGEHN